MCRQYRYLVIALVLSTVTTAGRLVSTVFSGETAPPKSTSHDDAALSQLIDLVAARGLVDGAMPDPRASEHVPSPVPGASVSESAATLRKTGEEVGKVKIWGEPFGPGSLEFQEIMAETGQISVEYWVLAPGGRRCIFNGGATYGKDGHLLHSNFWRNDPQMRVPGSSEFPSDIFPSRVPASAFLRSLDAPEPGASGTLNMVMGTYGYMTFDLWAKNIEQISVHAGTFQTLKVIMRPDADSIMQDWPAFIIRLAQPFMPKNLLYYDTSMPHHLVKFIGSFGYPAPELTVEMTRTYIATGPAQDGMGNKNNPH